jgi:hypothetical protein
VEGESEHETAVNDEILLSEIDHGRGHDYSSTSFGGIVHVVIRPSRRQPDERSEATGCVVLYAAHPRDQVYLSDGSCRMVSETVGGQMNFDVGLF